MTDFTKFYDDTTCWENKDLSFMEVPTCTRVSVFKNDTTLVTIDQITEIQKNTREEKFDSVKMYIPVKTVLTNVLLGMILWTKDVFPKIQSRIKLVEKDEDANCFVFPTSADGINVAIVTKKHISKNEAFCILRFAEGIDESVLEKVSEEDVRYLYPWFPKCTWNTIVGKHAAWFLANNKYSTLSSLRSGSEKENQFLRKNKEKSWQNGLVELVLLSLEKPQERPALWVIDMFAFLYCKDRKPFPILLAMLFVEGMCNSGTNRQWFLNFTVKTIESERALT